MKTLNCDEFLSVRKYSIMRTIVRNSRLFNSAECLIQWSEDSDHEYALSFLTEKHRDEIM